MTVFIGMVVNYESRLGNGLAIITKNEETMSTIDLNYAFEEMKELVKGLDAVDARDSTKMADVISRLARIGDLFREYSQEMPEDLSDISQEEASMISDLFSMKCSGLRASEGIRFDQAECNARVCIAIAGLMMAIMAIWHDQFSLGPELYQEEL